ncbi:MAG TPA: kinase, partial [Novosphingobium sp.]|nr:kinase [Novosphingobium sp.]
MCEFSAMAGPDPLLLDALLRRIGQWRAGHSGLFVLGLSGSQGSGKTTLVAGLEQALEAQGLRVARLSLDDLYLTRAERIALGQSVHPLLATRGVPGTHDVALGLEVIAALERGKAAALPRFDKGRDDRADPATWP